MIGGKYDNDSEDYPYLTTKANSFNDENLRRFDYGLGFKAALEFKNKYQFTIVYDIGLANMYEEKFEY